ncbi:hypothetical protein BB780_10025 [Stenotrophomonas maltophilia]|nr:hypothetical protein BB780_10025 [Stenotrophomonas maltophilia]QDY48053.1 hypothetical protein DUW70_05615 [Stenotrophomonas maltophilia]
MGANRFLVGANRFLVGANRFLVGANLGSHHDAVSVAASTHGVDLLNRFGWREPHSGGCEPWFAP